ncbi:MAG: SDR family oxidoreductase [Hyphomicrobiaceae bacterium]
MMLQSRALAQDVSLKQYPELAGKRVLVTGAERRAGSSIARAFARQQARLILQAARLNGGPGISGTSVRVFQCRPRSPAEIERLADAASTAHAGLDIAVGVTALPAGWREMLAEDSDRPVIDALRLPFHLAGRIADRMRMKNIRGTLVTVAMLPAPGDRGDIGRMLLRAGLMDLVQRQAEEFASAGIRAYGIAAEPLIANAWSRDAGDGPGIARTGRGRAIAEVALQLASDQARFLSGQTLTV